MSDSLGSWIPGLDPLTGTLTLPLWAAGALAALFVVFCVLAFSRAGREGMVGGHRAHGAGAGRRGFDLVRP